jgi:RHS repeat-associated protein
MSYTLRQVRERPYDGDGNRVRSVITAGSAVTETHYVGAHYERTLNSGNTKYYYIAGQLVAFERSSGYGVDWGRRFVFRDHLGSTNVIINGSSGLLLWRDRYLPFGDVRDTYRRDAGFSLQTQYRFTGQRLEQRLGTPEGGLDRGLYFYGARWYDSSLGRFIQADTIVPQPGNPQALNRYAYVLNNPLRFNDPSGHWANIPSVNGSIGSTGLASGGTLGMVAHPAAQSLTVGTSLGQKDVIMRAAPPDVLRPDDGVLLLYANPGALRPRTEVVGYAAGLPDNTPFVGARIEERHVTTYQSFLDWSVRASYVETAISGRVGPLGAEWAGAKGTVDPTIGLGPVELQPGQLMVGLTNPTGGPGGVRGGVEFQLSSNSLFVTTREYLNEIGGARVFGQRRNPDGTLIREVYVPGQRTRWGWMSGHDRLRWQLWGMGLEAEEVP